MNKKIILRFLGNFSLLECAFLFLCLLFAIYDREQDNIFAIALTIALLLALGLLFRLVSRNAEKRFYASEGYFLVGIAWIYMSLGGALPFFFSGTLPNFFDAFFEAVSGFTTTGATLLESVEESGRALLLWRSLTNWIGGMGILVFLLAIVAGSKGKNSHAVHLLRAESPGPSVEKTAPRMRAHAQILYAIYIALTVILFAALLFCRIPLFDALNLALTTAGTGGFGVRSSSFFDYGTAAQLVIMAFMVIFGINFHIYYLIVLRRRRAIRQDEELRVYLLMLLSATVMIFLNTLRLYPSAQEALLHSAFAVTSMSSSTGLSTVDFAGFPMFSKAILLLLMIVGACAGSTSGGMKVSRIIILFKSLRRSLQRTLHPRSVRLVRLSGRAVDEEIVSATATYTLLYICIVLTAFLLVSVDNQSLETTLSSVLACMGNTGLGLDGIGPSGGYGSFSIFSRMVLAGCMLLGRLEIFPYLVFLDRKAWNRAC